MAPRTVLIAVDAGSATLDALRLGELLARVAGLPVALASVFPLMPLDSEPEAELREDARQTLLELGATLEGVEVADARVVEARSAARALHRLSEDEQAAVVVIGSTRRGPVGRIVPGTIAERLLAGAACPIAVAPAGYGERPDVRLHVIGVAYDGSEEARLALDGAVELARRARGTLRIQTVVDELLEGEARTALDEAVTRHGGEVDLAVELAAGDAAEVLAARSTELDLLVTGSRGYGPVGAVLLGGTTHRLLSGLACPLLVTPRGRGLVLDG